MSEFIISGFYDEASGDLNKQIALIKELGESYLCPRTLNGKNIASYTSEEFVRDIKPVLDENGIKFSSIGSPIGKVGIDDEEGFERQKKQLAELIKIAQVMQCGYIRVFSFFYGKRDPDSVRDKVICRFKEFLKIAKGSGVKLMHENEKKIYGDTPERVLELYRELKCEELTLCFDASNYVQCNVEPLTAFDMLKEHTEYYHIKDCSRFKVEVPVGTGEGRYREILAELKRRGYQGFLTLEPHTLKYSILKLPVYFVPFVPVALNNYFKAFRKIDRDMGVPFYKKVSAKEVFIWQYERLKKLLAE